MTDLTVVIISGGLPDGSARTATGEGHHWTREPNESEAAFISRVIEAAREAGLSNVAIGGLPDRPR
jgi:hypothetical protein